MPVDSRIEPGREAALRQLVREREAERDDLGRRHPEHHRGAVERGDLGAAVVERGVRDPQDLSREHRIARERVGQLRDVAVGVGAHPNDLERGGGETREAAFEGEGGEIDVRADVGWAFLRAPHNVRS